jgi:hypothetical protein
VQLSFDGIGFASNAFGYQLCRLSRHFLHA